MKSVLHCSAVVLLAGVISSAAAEENPINLGRLSIARVYASSALEGVQKTFDDQVETAWESADHNPWVRVTFTKPIRIHSMTFTSRASGPDYYQVHIRHPGENAILAYPLIKAHAPTSAYVLPHPVANVDEVWITFLGAAPVKIDNLAIMGDPAEDVKQAEVIPPLDHNGPAFVKELERLEARHTRRDYSKF